MKKLSLFLALIITTGVVLSSCLVAAPPQVEEEGGEVDATLPDPDEEYYTVFRSDVRASIISAPNADRKSVNAISNAFSNALGYQPLRKSSTAEIEEYEIVLGETDREISAEAYTHLTEMEDRGGFYARYLIYAEGRSVAFAFDSSAYVDVSALEHAANHFASTYFSESGVDKVKIPHGIVSAGYINLLDEQAKIDEVTIADEWNYLKTKLQKKTNGDAIYKALESLYNLYDPEIAIWIANLYEPFNCYCGNCERGRDENGNDKLACYGGGFYYSNSARDNEGYYPDAESTMQALNLISGSGIVASYVTGLPSWMPKQMVHFVRELQDENGFYYHPQWSKADTDKRVSRRARDLNWCNSILESYGAIPKYDTPSGMKGEESLGAATGAMAPLTSGSAAYFASRVVSVASYASHLESDVTFKAYLARNLPKDALPGKGSSNGFYSIGNTLTSQMAQIKNRDRQLQKEGVTYSLVDILIDWLNTYQNPETGHWSVKEDYAGTNGLLKISGIYNSAGVQIPNSAAAARSAINAITSKESVGSVVDIYNTWYAASNIISNVKSYGTDTVTDGVTVTKEDQSRAIRAALYEIAPEAIEATRQKVMLFKKADGSFSYNQTHSSATSQGMPVAVPGTNEGDVNATIICTTGIIGNIFSCLGLTSYPKICHGVERMKFTVIVTENYEKSLIETN